MHRQRSMIITGATGFAGAAILERLLADRRVVRVTSVGRRAPALTSPKLEVVVQADMGRYDEALLDGLAEHDGCLWALGGKVSDAANVDDYRRVTHDYTLALARGLAERAARPMSFCYLSGMGADRTESAWLPWERVTRHLKGRTERDLVELQRAWPHLRAFCFRPGGILPASQARVRRWLSPITVGVDELARAMVEVALDAAPAEDVVGNSEIQSIAELAPRTETLL